MCSVLLPSFAYDNARRVQAVTDLDTSSLSWTYGYDPLDRLSSASDASQAESWTYDTNGNRLTQMGGGQAAGSYTYSGASQPCAARSVYAGSRPRADDLVRDRPIPPEAVAVTR